MALNAGVTWGIARLLNPRLLSLTRFGVLELGNSFDRLRACGPSAGRFDGLKTPSLSRGSGPVALRQAQGLRLRLRRTCPLAGSGLAMVS